MKKLVVDKKYHEKKLNKFLLENLPGLTFSLFCKTLQKKDIKINGKRVHEDILLHAGDEVLVYLSDEILAKKQDLTLPIVYEDDNILVIHKPSHLEVVGTASLTEQIHKLYTNCGFKPMPCHRIDRNTTGLVLFAKNETALTILFNKFKHHEIEKHYLALVYGIPKDDKKRMEDYLFKDQKKSRVFISDTPKKGYVNIITTYTILEKRNNNTSLLDVEIETGRTHQIRAHLAYLGFPIIGDGKYGKNEINKQFQKKEQMLCSYRLKFNFKTDAGILNYLNKKEIKLDDIHF